MQGPHQTAQKSSKTTLPFKSSSVIDEPFTHASTNNGAASWPISSDIFLVDAIVRSKRESKLIAESTARLGAAGVP